MRTHSIGKHNPKLVEIRKAIRTGVLTNSGLLPVEGRKLVEEAARSGLEITDLFVREGESIPSVSAAHVFTLDLALFKSIQATDTSQGVLALVRPRSFSLDDLFLRPNPLIVTLARLQDPGNVGTIIRLAEAFGASGCIAFEGTAGQFNPKTVRASAGSLFRLPCVWNTPAGESLTRLRSRGLQVLGSSPDGDMAPEACDWRRGAVLLIGNEGAGLNHEERAACDALIRIKQNSEVDSLNSAIATAIILYEGSKQRGNK